MDEQGRLNALYDYRILDTPPEIDFDRLTRLAASVCNTPIAVISMVDDRRQWFKSTHGLALTEIDRAFAFCTYTIQSHEPLQVTDAQLDPRFANNPLVRDEPWLRFYAGVPLISPNGYALGSLAVLDTEPRQLTAQQLESLITLAQQVVLNLELRRQQYHLEHATHERVRKTLFAAATGIAMSDIEGRFVSVNPAFCRMLNYTEAELVNRVFTTIIHPDDLSENHALLQKLLTGETEEFTQECRGITKDGAIVWIHASVSAIYSNSGHASGLVTVTKDITARREAEAKARRLSERMVLMMESITDAFIALDCDWNFTYVNNEAERLILRSRNDLLGKSIWDAFPEIIGSSFEHYYRQAVTERHKVTFEAYFPPLAAWFRVNAYPSPEGLTIYFQNINPLRQYQERLRLLETCVEHMNDMVLITEAEPLSEPGPRILFVNHAFVTRTGYSRDEVLGRSPRFLQGPNSQRAALDEIRTSLESGESVRTEIINYTKQGAEFWLEMDIMPIANEQGDVTHMVGVGRDITERKINEQKLYESEERFKLVAKATADAIWDWNLITDELWWSEGVQTLFGITLDEMEPSSNSWISRIHPDEKENILDHIFDVIDGHENNWIHEYHFLRKDGSYAYVQDRGFVIRAADGKALRMLGGMTDLTSTKQTELEMMRINELERARQTAELANQTKSNFLATMSHEIRTPISGVIGMVDVLHQTSLKGYQVEMIDVIHDSAYSLLGIIDDILDFSKIEAGKMDIESAPLSIMNVVKSVCVMLDRLAENKGVELTLFTDPLLQESLLGDSLRLRQVLVNLINNAIKFSSGLERTGQVSMRAILIEQTPRAVVVEFQIIDNGIGMTEGTIGRLFNPFVQADTSTTRQFGGTGLGLTICRHLAELMKGEIYVQSTPNSGSQFNLRLPFPRMQVPLPVETQATVSVAGLSCLIIGDEAGLASDWQNYLTSSGADVTRVSSLADLDFQADFINPPQGIWVWVIDSHDDKLQINVRGTAIHPAWQHCDIRWVIIGRGQRRKPRLEQKNLVKVDGNILDYHTFLRAIAIAAGRAEEEVAPLHVGRDASAFLPPLRELALQQQRLILVAEDNETNQKVILRQLAMLGYAADIVANGREAFKRWQSGEYALLITDLHMPEMDGYALVQEIRVHENGLGYIPVIALSANAVRGEAERCHALGIDEYLTKPASLAELQTLLERWLPIQKSEPFHDAPLQIISTTAERDVVEKEMTINIQVLKDLVGDDPGIVREFLLDFQRSALGMVEDLNGARAAGQLARIGAIAHKLKSSARSVGAKKLGDICDHIEIKCKQESEASLMGSLAKFDAEILEVKQALNHLLK